MPYTAKQIKLFRAAAHDPKIAKIAGISQHDAGKMLKESKGKKVRKPISTALRP